MKRILCIFMVLCVILALFGCSDMEQKKSPSKPTPTPPNPYADILNALMQAYPWDDSDTEVVSQYPELSYMYRRCKNLSDVGYALVDVDGNGQDELILTSMDNPFVFDLFTVQNGKVIQVFSSGERYSHVLYEDGIVIERWSSSAYISGNDYFQIQQGNLVFIERVTYDAYYAVDVGVIPMLGDADGENSYFHSTTQDEADYRHISIDEMGNITAKYDAIAPLDYTLTPLSDFNPQTSTTENTIPTNPYHEILTAIINGNPQSIEPVQTDFYYDPLNYEDLSGIGYAFLDVDGDGQQELLLSEFDRPPVFYLYTIQDGKAVLLFRSSERCYYTLYEDGYITCRWLISAGSSGKDFLRLENGNLVFQERSTLDVNHAVDVGIIPSEQDPDTDNCYFLSDTPNAADYRHVTKDVAMQHLADLEEQLTPLEFTLMPLSEYQP